MFYYLPFNPELSSTYVTYMTSYMCLFMCKRHLKHCYVKYVNYTDEPAVHMLQGLSYKKKPIEESLQSFNRYKYYQSKE